MKKWRNLLSKMMIVFPLNYFIGSADGCPPNSPPPQSPPGYYPPGSCLNDWTQDDVNKLSNEYSSSRSIPMNYNTTGANADQWYSIGIYSFNTHNDKITFCGTMTQETACDQMEISDTNVCVGIDNSLEFGYQQFLIRVVDESRIESPLTWGTDMKYYYGEP